MADSQITLMTWGQRSIGNGVEEKTPATGKQEELVRKVHTGEPVIHGSQHTSEPLHQSEGKPGYRSIRRFGTESCGRKAVATPPEDRFSIERKRSQETRQGACEILETRMPDKPLLIRVRSVPDFRETTFNPVTKGGRKRCGEAR